MAAKYGVNVTISAEAARPIAVESTTPIGIAGYEEVLEDGIHFYMTTKKALEALDEKYEQKKSSSQTFKKGSIYKALKAIDDQAVNTQIILSVFSKDDDEETNDEVTACKQAINNFKNAKAKTAYRPNIIIAPGFSHEDAIKGEIESTAKKLKATGIVDIKANSASEAIGKMGAFGTRRLIAAYPNVKTWNEENSEYEYTPQSARIAGMIAYVDGQSEFGYSDSYSNRVMGGVFGTEVDIDFELGETCTADELRGAKISTVIREQGFRAWGGETSDIDTIWQDLARVRIFDRISEAAQKGVLFAIDRKASELYHAKRSVEELLRSLVGAKVLLGFELSWSEKNTDATVSAGKFYLDVRMQNNPIVKQLTLDFIYVDSYSKLLLEDLK
ncbi:phage tail sheath protein FI [Campylobacter pinnipediorum subsp. caledonicus]|uniref:phage tail sheath family protein n=1 Tax=Campylobacter pinnipediorum TaxID=1965231 RepID=UPI00099569AD|nr:phage tail sheath subtilisin-like domain-containing protein [Campylobacter pinnipediorum]AQW85492.1 phage tail sheath protein FI [Campylobacter pinnipediorum subsp. caledonicus]